MKGVLICGGSGTRLKPLTDITNKSLLPVYDKPLIEYPLTVLQSAGIQEIMVVTGAEHMDQIAAYLGSGSRFGCVFTFGVQEKPQGIAQALGLAEAFADGDSVCAILGDNVFFDDLSSIIKAFSSGAHLFLKEVHDPERFGVATMSDGIVTEVIEEWQKQLYYKQSGSTQGRSRVCIKLRRSCVRRSKINIRQTFLFAGPTLPSGQRYRHLASARLLSCLGQSRSDPARRHHVYCRRFCTTQSASR